MKTTNTHSQSVLRLALSAGLATVLLLPVSGNAAHYTGQCSSELNAVELAIDNANFLGKRAETDRSNLQAKLEATNAKIILLKYSDAIDKLTDISDTATALADAAKPKLEDATAINEAVASAIGCAGSLP